jgi:hypothetical protein
MATIHKLDQKKQADHRTALLGLAADQPASAGVCPTSAEMADLVDNVCTAEIKERLFRHIAVCETCYREWLTLQEVLGRESKKKSKIVRLFKPGNMALAGTLLAAAVSVVVFLNIYHPVNTPLTVPVGSIRQGPSSPVHEEEKSEPVLQDKDTLSVPQKSSENSESSQKKQELPASADAVRAEKKRSSPAAPKAIPSPPAPNLKKPSPARESIPAEQVLEGAADGAVKSQRGGRGEPLIRRNRLHTGGDVYGNWWRQIEIGCSEGQTSEAFWREMERKGREIEAHSGELQPDEQKTVENLLVLVSGMEKTHVTEQCRKINALLAEARKGRADGLP